MRGLALCGACLRRGGIAGLMAMLLTGCAILDGEVLGSSAPGGAGASASAHGSRFPWLDDPAAYAGALSGASTSRRARAREEAIAYLLRDPRAEAAVRLQLVVPATVQSVEEAHEALDDLAAARDQVTSPYARAVLASMVVTTERLQAVLRARVETENLLNVENARRAGVEAERDRLAREYARVRAQLDDAQGKLRALMSIEEQLQEGT